MSDSQYFHRRVGTSVNLEDVVSTLFDQFVRLIGSVEVLFLNNGAKAKKVQKTWYGKQLTNAQGASLGQIYFTVTNRDITKKNEFDLDDPNALVTDLEYSLHIKQNESVPQARAFVSGSLRHRTSWGDLDRKTTIFQMYNGIDVESALFFRDLLKEVEQQITAFEATNENLLAESDLKLVPLMMHGGSLHGHY